MAMMIFSATQRHHTREQIGDLLAQHLAECAQYTFLTRRRVWRSSCTLAREIALDRCAVRPLGPGAQRCGRDMQKPQDRDKTLASLGERL